MNKIINELLLARDKFMPFIGSLDLHIELVYHLQKNKETVQKFKETGDSQYIYQR